MGHRFPSVPTPTTSNSKMVCKTTSTSPNMKTKTPPKLRKEMKALRSIVPNTSQKPTWMSYYAISYIKNLEAKLTHPQDLLKAQFIAQHRMNLQKSKHEPNQNIPSEKKPIDYTCRKPTSQ